jgi:hypothetical protein
VSFCSLLIRVPLDIVMTSKVADVPGPGATPSRIGVLSPDPKQAQIAEHSQRIRHAERELDTT